jgi:membrane protein
MTACIKTHHIGAYAAQAAFFFVLSLIPILLLLLTLVQYTPVTKQAVTDALLLMFPSTVEGLMLSIIDQVYAQSVSVIPVTLLVALWTAGKGVLAMTSGLNIIYENTETRNYIYLRIRASFYIIIFILAIILSLTLSVFGNTISIFVYQHLRILSPIVDFIIRIRTHFTLIVLTIFWELVYKYLPNRTNLANTKITTQLPGAIFTAIGWLLISFVFSIYLDIFKGFSNMYGSLTTIILIMLWLYFCMYTILLGGTLNTMLEGWNWKLQQKKKIAEERSR